MYTWRERDNARLQQIFFRGFSSVESLASDVNVKTFLGFMEIINEPVGCDLPETGKMRQKTVIHLMRVYKAFFYVPHE